MNNENDWLGDSEADQIIILTNAKNKLANYQVQFGLSAAQVTRFVELATAMIEIITKVGQIRETAKAFTEWKKEALLGNTAKDMPEVPVFTVITLPAGLNQGVETQIRDFVANVKTLDGYTKQAGEDLMFERVKPAPDPIADAQPVLTVKAIGNFQVEVSYKKRDFDGIILEYRAEGSSQWLFADKVSVTKFEFTPQLTAAGQPQRFEFRARYILKNEQVGQWSQLDVVSVI